MPIDASGFFTRVYDWATDRANGVKIIAARMDGEFNNYADALNTAVWRNGVVAMTGNLKLGSNRITGLGDGSSASPSATFTNSATTGIYSSGVDMLSGTAGGVKVFDISATVLSLFAGASTVFTAAAATTTVKANNVNLVVGNATDSWLYCAGTAIMHAVAGSTIISSTTGNGITLDATGMTFNSIPTIFGNPVWNAAALAQATLSGSQTLDFKTFINLKITLNGALTLVNPVSINVGQGGVLTLKQDATGNRSASWGTLFDWAGGTVPTLSTAANAEDVIAYYIESATSIKCVLVGKAFA